MKEIIIDGIKIEVQKKKIKNMYLKVLYMEKKVLILAPLRTKNSTIYEFAQSKITWIRKQTDKYSNYQVQEPDQYNTGDYVYLFGNPYRLEIEYGERSQVIQEGAYLILKLKDMENIEARKHLLNEWYREQLKSIIPILVKKWEAIIGVTVNEWRIKNMKTRWGTCNIKDKRIWLNLQLASKKMDCLEYVVVHEMVHLLEKSHNERFKAYMSHFLPDWQSRKMELNGIDRAK